MENLHHLVWDGKEGGVPNGVDVSLAAARERCGESIKHMRSDHLRYSNPTPYKVSVSEQLFNFIHKLWLEEAPAG